MKILDAIRAWVCLALALIIFNSFAYCYSVTALKATYNLGQVFLTWKNPNATNLKYKVYRSTKKLTTSSQLSSATYLGYVRDNSAKNIRKSDGTHSFYFTIDPTKGPLTSDQGLYVATCTDSKKYFYAVTVLDLTTTLEDKTIVLGGNSLKTAILESIATPQPVLEQSETLSDGTVQYEYAQWGNNQSPAHYPAFNNAGSYAYNFSIFNRGNNLNGPLYVYFKDNNPFSSDGTDLCTDCSVLKMDDWLPNGSNTYWVGWQLNYDMYSTVNPVGTTGIVTTYSQARVRKTLQWVRKHWTIDSNQVYLTGNSHNGFGALLTSVVSPDQVAAVYATSAPIIVKAVNGDTREEMWCDNALNLPSDVIDPRTGKPILIWYLMDMRRMYAVDNSSSIPFNVGINGKNDVTAGWPQQFHWYDSLNATRQGGTWYWDQRVHGGTGAQFTDSEMMPNYTRFRINRSYPGFAYCSINQNPGNGLSTDGDPNGAINGYLDWDDNSTSDQSCQYSITCFVKNMYMGGLLYPNQYDSCTTDITLRRIQHFKPIAGAQITWSVKNSQNVTVQSGSFTYNSGPVTLYGLKIYRTKSTISLSINGCQKSEQVHAPPSANAYVISAGNDYELVMNLKADDRVQLKLFDMNGRMISDRYYPLEKGLNSIPIQSLQPGMYIALVEGNDFRDAVKFVYMK